MKYFWRVVLYIPFVFVLSLTLLLIFITNKDHFDNEFMHNLINKMSDLAKVTHI